MKKHRFYIDTHGNDDEAYREAMQFACELATEFPELKRVILLAGDKASVGWLDRLYGPTVVKKLFAGTTFKGCPPTFKIETVKTYRDGSYSNDKDIVIGLGLGNEEISKLENYYKVGAIIGVPWMANELSVWVGTWSPKELRGKASESSAFPAPSCIVKKALDQLTNRVNLTTGITHPNDEQDAKTFILALHKYEPELDANVVGAYLQQNGWHERHANEVKKLVQTLNEGKFFRGGTRTGLKEVYNRWKTECK